MQDAIDFIDLRSVISKVWLLVIKEILGAMHTCPLWLFLFPILIIIRWHYMYYEIWRHLTAHFTNKSKIKVLFSRLNI